jgi:tetratricopeptide (TPR) repeat protein
MRPRGTFVRREKGLAAFDPERLLLELAVQAGLLTAKGAQDAYATHRARPLPGGLPELLARRGVPADVLGRLRLEVGARMRQSTVPSPAPPSGVAPSLAAIDSRTASPNRFDANAITIAAASKTDAQLGNQPTRRDLPNERSFRPKAGTRFGRYELLEEVGRGGMGIVFKARQSDLDRIVAVKVLLTGDAASDFERDRFFAEARHAAKLAHRSIVSVHDVGEIDGIHYFTMDFIEGKDLGTYVRDQGRLPSDEAIRLAIEIGDGLAYAHEQEVVHRDLKPSNILIDRTGHARITDFGLAKDLSKSSTTRAGEVLGTPSYMPPEQAEGRSLEVDARADIYSLGACIYEMLSGRPPFIGKTSYAVLQAVMQERPLSLCELVPSTPRDLDTIVQKCLEKKREDRYPSAGALTADLGRFVKGDAIAAVPVRPPLLGRKARLAVGVVAALGILGTGVVLYVRSEREKAALEKAEAERKLRAAEELAKAAREADEKRIAAEKAAGLLRESAEAQARGERDRAVSLALDAVEAAPSLALAHATLARAYLELRNDAMRALEEAEVAIKLDSQDLDAHGTEVRALVLSKRVAEALDACGTIDRLGVAGATALAARLRGEALLARGDAEAGLRELQRATSLAPRDASAHLALARAFLEGNDAEGAERAASAAHEVEPRLAAALVVRADARSRLGRREDAARDAAEAVRLAPQDPEARVLLDRLEAAPAEGSAEHARLHKAAEAALAALRQGDRAAVEAWLAAPHPGDCATLLAMRASALWGLGRLGEADDAFTRAIEANPKDMALLGNRGLIREKEKRWLEALADFDAALAPGVPAGMYPAVYGRARVLGHLERWADAEQEWKRLLDLIQAGPERGELFHQRAKNFFATQKRWGEAEEDLTQAIALVPGNAHLVVDRGDMREKKGDSDGAVADWNAALGMKPIAPQDEERAREGLKRASSR